MNQQPELNIQYIITRVSPYVNESVARTKHTVYYYMCVSLCQ